MAALGELLSYAYKEEAAAKKEELEKRLFPLWLANYAIAKVTGTGEIVDYEQFLQTVFSEDMTPKKKPDKKRTADDIIAELMPFVEADKKKGG